MRCGIVLPGGTAAEQLQQALLAEESGWDAVFVWEAAYGVDAWSLLAAMAARTSRIRLGTLLTPLPWRRPWKVASQAATVDQLSGGRVIVTVGIGALGTELPETGEVLDVRQRAEMMDDGIDLMARLWQGGTSHHGHHYDYEGGSRPDLVAAVRPVQERIPIWVVGVWPRPKSMRRVLRCEGVVPQYQLGDGEEPRPASASEVRAWLDANGGSAVDLISEGETPSDDQSQAADTVAEWAEAGCTWWIESRWNLPDHGPESVGIVRDRIASGPPRLSPRGGADLGKG